MHAARLPFGFFRHALSAFASFLALPGWSAGGLGVGVGVVEVGVGVGGGVVVLVVVLPAAVTVMVPVIS